MGSTVRLTDSALVGCTHNAVSAGEESEVGAYALLIADSKLGILSKNASRVRLTRSLIYHSGTALASHRPQLYYTGASTIGASDLFAVDCGKVSDASRGTTIDMGQMQTVLPVDTSLDQLRRSLGLLSWRDLDGLIASLRTGVGR
jgi:hypothetical protein